MRYVLFVCTHNAGRSQMAQAFFEHHAPPDLRAESAGQAPADAIWPNVVEAMREVGIDISGRKPKKIDLEMQLHADKAITLNCQESCPYVIGGVEDWEVDDPAGQPLEMVQRSATRSSAAFATLWTIASKRSAPIEAAISAGSRSFFPRSQSSSRRRSARRRSVPVRRRFSAATPMHLCGRSS